MKKLILSVAFILGCFAFSASAQSDDCVKMLDKALNEVSASRAVIVAQKEEVEAWKRVDAANKLVDAAKDRIILSLEKQNERLLAVKCSKTSFLFGLISKKTCF
jgi:hydrogenase maturation factor HypF (carbamoyltransferase family)